MRNMSDSAMRVNPAIEEPSIHWPPSMTCSRIDDGDGHALDVAHDVGELQVDELDAVLLDPIEDFLLARAFAKNCLVQL